MRKSGFGSLGTLIAIAATLFAGGSARAAGIVPAQGGRGAAPALGGAINTRYAGGGASCGQKERRKLAWSNVGRKRGVKCQGRPAGKGRRASHAWRA